MRILVRPLLAVALTVAMAGAVSSDALAVRGPLSADNAVAVNAAPGRATVVPGWKLQSSAKVPDEGAAISTPGYATPDWYPVSPRSTVLAGLVENKVHQDPLYSNNLSKIPAADFKVPWWYRADVTVQSRPGVNTFLDFSGVTSAADVWVNGVQVATRETVAGTYTRHEFNLTALVKPGVNSIAFKVYPNDPRKHLTLGWVDWLQPPPDNNMGLFRDVTLRRSGAIALRQARVLTKLTSGGRAELTAKVDARNDSDHAVRATVAGTVGDVAVRQDVDLPPRETKTLTFDPRTDPQLALRNPRLWWPAGMGAQPMYGLHLTATVGGKPSDSVRERFGIREVQAPVVDGIRRYSINGRPLLIRGGGWSADIFLRWNKTYLEDKIRATRDVGLNTIRLEGHLETDEFFELTDKYGILALPGWQCCNKWEAEVNEWDPGEKWSPADYVVAKNSMKAEAERLRNHPSVLSFLIGSDWSPQGEIEKNYVDALRAADWPTPVVPAAATRTSPITGPSGMKMTGPYDWVPPSYWYHKREGGAVGFNGETSAGPDVPTLDTLRRMMTPAELDTLWQDPNAKQYHRSPSRTFSTLKIFNNAIIGRYGKPTSLEDYVRKAQLAQYENVRAQLEAYGRNFSDAAGPSTGVIYWMLNSGWPSLHWQIFDYFLDQGGSYHGAKKANEPLHVQYSYDDRSVVVVNHGPVAASGLTAEVKLYNLDGTEKFSQTVRGLSVAGGGARAQALVVPEVAGLSGAYLARLVLSDARGKPVSRNVYWLSTKDDVIDWSRNDWYYVPTLSYADMTSLSSMPQTQLSATASSTEDSSGNMRTTVTLHNASSVRTPAFFVDAHVVDGKGAPVLPAQWTDNAVSLWPGETITLTATYRPDDLHGSTPSVRITGWNIPTQTIRAD
jgi:exo-1,4-beta-D-glucosaminidase